jgi:hypothetical protein
MFWHSSRHARSTARLSEITRYVPNPTGIDVVFGAFLDWDLMMG